MTFLTPEDHVLDGDVERADDSSNHTSRDHDECEQDEKIEKSEAVDDDEVAASSKTPITQRTSTTTLLFNLVGSVFFFAGSIGFIWSTWTDEWLRPYQSGSNLWVLGSICFLLPLLALWKTRYYAHNGDLCSYVSSCWSRAELCLFGGLMCFIVGCSLGATGWSEKSVVGFLNPINALFLTGCALLLVDCLMVAWSHQKCNTVACRPDEDDDDDDDDGDSAPFPFIGLVVAGSYVFASVLGGYGGSQGVVRVGMFGWIVGSIVGLHDTIPELYQRYRSSQSDPTPPKRVPSPTPTNAIVAAKAVNVNVHPAPSKTVSTTSKPEPPHAFAKSC
jgi:hypothetical protein